MVSCRVLVPALIIGFGGSFHYGYQLYVLNPSFAAFQKFINISYHDHYGSYLDTDQWSYVWSFVVNTQLLGCLIGSFFIGYLMGILGGKRGFYFTNGLQIFSCALQSLAMPINVWELLAVGRFLSGIAQCFQFTLEGVYFMEISQKSERGLIGSITGLFVNVGVAFASTIAMPMILGNDDRWPYLFLVSAGPSILCMIILPFIPDSPVFLAGKNQYGTAAESLHRLGRSELEIKEELFEIRQELAQNSAKSGSTSMRSLISFFRTPYIRKGIFLGWMVILSMAYSGIFAISYFSTGILQNSGFSLDQAIYGTLALSIFGLIGSVIGTLVVDKFGRRKIMLISNSSLLILNISFIVFAYLTRVHSLTWSSYGNVVVIILMVPIYGFGPGNVQWFLTSELLPQHARTTMNGITMIIRWILSGSAAFVFLPLHRTIHEFSFFIHAVPLMASIIYFAIALPETRNRSTLSIMQDLGYSDDETSDNGLIVNHLKGNEVKIICRP